MSVEDFVTPQPTDAERSAATTLLRMIWGTHISRAVYVAAELGIADLLADGPLSSSELARRTGTHAQSLYRVLRLLAVLGVLDRDDAGAFSLTIVGERLRTDAPAGLRSWATFLDAIGAIRGFEQILGTVRTGRPGFELAHATTLFESLHDHPDRAAAFDTAMSERTTGFAPRSPTDTTSPTSAPSWTSAAARASCWSRSCAATITSRAFCSTSQRPRPARTRYSMAATSPIAATSRPATSSREFPRAPTATSWRTSCTTGTTPKPR
jgi:Dimerisation domain